MVGLAEIASTSEGRSRLEAKVDSDDGTALQEIETMLASVPTTEAIGEVEQMFGPQLGPRVEVLASHYGVTTAQISTALPRLLPITVGLLAQHKRRYALSGDWIQDLLAEEQQDFTRNGFAPPPPQVADGSTPESASYPPKEPLAAAATTEPVVASSDFPWPALAILVVLAVLMVWWII